MNDWLAATEETEPLTKKYQDELIPYATSKQSSRSIFQFFFLRFFRDFSLLMKSGKWD